MRNESLLTIFFVFSTAALGLTWWLVASRSSVSGAVYGFPNDGPLGSLMAALLVVWFILAVTVAILNRPHHEHP